MSINTDAYPIFGPFIGLMGAVLGFALSFSGAAYGTVKTGTLYISLN